MKLGDLLRPNRKGAKLARPEEIEALQRVLRGDDPRFALLIEQLRTTPEVRREQPAPDRFLVAPTSTTEDLAFVLEVTRVVSAWIPVRDLGSGRTLEFRASVARSGFLDGLEGRTADGEPWPEAWEVAPPEHPHAGEPALVLPSLEEIEAAQRRAKVALEEWLGVTLRDDLTLYPPVPEPVVHTRQGDLGARFTMQYLRFLAITDGIESRDLRVLGHQDVYLVDDPSFDAVVIAWDGDETDDFVAIQDVDGGDEAVRRIDVHERQRRLRDVAPDLATYLRDRLGTRTKV